jgi:uncharacterized protein involved in type VI secretion and phage assembly
MAEDQNSLTLYLAGGGYDDLYPWDLVLEEGFSRLYRGELTVLSGTKHTLEELSGILDKGISVDITQSVGIGESGVQRTRYLHGIVTGVRCTGVFNDGIKKDCYSYVLTIEPELARLKFTRLSAPYYRMNPPAIFEAILKNYHLAAYLDQAYVSRTRYIGNLLFDQSDMSDFDFIHGIAWLYGISFTFTHSKVPANTLGVAALYFSDGGKFPRSDLIYSDKRIEPEIAAFDFLRADGGRNVWKMDMWAMNRSIGFDGFKLSAAYPDTNYGSEQWQWGQTGKGERCLHQRSLFHAYERATPVDDVDRDVALIMEARRLTMEQDKDRWTAAAPNLALRPGLILELAHFYGAKDREMVTALVTRSSLHHHTRWPTALAVGSGDPGGEVTEVRAVCVDWGKKSKKRYCPA